MKSEKQNRFLRRKLIQRAQSQGRVSSECFNEVLQSFNVDLRPNTIRSYRLAVRNYLRLIGDIGINETTPREADAFKSKRAGEVSAYSTNVDLRALKSIFNRLHRWQYIDVNPFASLKLVRIPHQETPFFSELQLQQIINSIPEFQFRAMIQLAYYTAVRLSEAVFLRWVDVNLPERIITIQNSEIFATKTKKNRVLPINDSLYGILVELHRTKRSEFVFPKDDGTAYRPDSISRRFKRKLQSLKFPASLHYHSVRHASASHLVAKNVPIYDVCRLLGHASVSTTERYSHLSPQNRRQVTNVLDLSASKGDQ